MPNLFMVGAPKAGTTSLVKYLERSGSVFFPSIKEPHFLYAKHVKETIFNVVDTVEEYNNLYANKSHRFLGDASVFGLQYYQTTIDNISSLYGNEVYIIIVLRNPVDRAYSAYLQGKRYNELETSSSFDDALSKNTSRTNISPMLQYIEGSRYYDAVKAYMTHFKNVKIVYSDELFSNTQVAVEEVYDFLKLDKTTLQNVKFLVHNEGGKDLEGVIKTFLLKKVFTQTFRSNLKKVSPHIHKILKQAIFKHFYHDAKALTPKEYNFYLTKFENDLLKLQQLLENDTIKNWSAKRDV